MKDRDITFINLRYTEVNHDDIRYVFPLIIKIKTD